MPTLDFPALCIPRWRKVGPLLKSFWGTPCTAGRHDGALPPAPLPYHTALCPPSTSLHSPLPRWRKVGPLLKSFWGNSLHLLGAMTEPKLLAFMLRRLRASAPLLAPFKSQADK